MERLKMLHERVTQNYEDYSAKMIATDKAVLFDSAWEIVAMSDAHYYMTETHDYSDDEIEFYLKFDNPLWIVADEWQSRQSDVSDLEYTMADIYNERDEKIMKHGIVDIVSSARV